MTLAAGEYLLLVKDVNLFSTKYTRAGGRDRSSPGARAICPTAARRSSSASPARQDVDGTRHWIRVDRVSLQRRLAPGDFPGGIDPWPVKADGQGSSLSRIDPAAYGNDPANWQAATPSPGSAN